MLLEIFRSSHTEVFLTKGVLKICSKFTGKQPCRNAISIKLLCNIIEIALRHGWSPVNLLHIFRVPFPRNTPEWLLLNFIAQHFDVLFPGQTVINECTYKFCYMFSFDMYIFNKKVRSANC